MRKSKFPYPRLNLPKEIKNADNFDVVETYIDAIADFIFTGINLNHDPQDQNHKYAWVLKVVSANLLRSLYIRNDVVDAINARNPIALFLGLKAWFEVVGVLAAIIDLLERNLPMEEFTEEFISYALGNRGKGTFRLGTVEAKNVVTMMEKADKYMRKILKKAGKENETDKFFTDFYDVASNPSHPSFDAYELVGSLQGDVWMANNPDQTKNLIVSNLPGYGGLLMAPLFVESICKELFGNYGEHFAEIEAVKYFEE